MSAGHSTASILVVDDDPAVRLLLRECFEMEGYAVVEAESGPALRQALTQREVQLVTLDLNLGGEDGLSLAREIRAVRNVPIVMITGKGDTIDRVVGLELGADDYIVKPFHIREVLARIRAVLRRYGQSDSGEETATGARPERGEDLLQFDGWILNVPRRELRSSDSKRLTELTTAEFDLLLMFARRPGRVMSRDNIMDLLKGHEWSPMDRSIDSLVARLRKKIERDSEAAQLIKTVRGVGYVFAGTVDRT